MLTTLCLTALTLAAWPAWLFLRNLRLYRPPREPVDPGTPPSVSVLIPARNEERSIATSVESALACRRVDLEVIVLDDHSQDATSEVVHAMAARDPRVRLHAAPELPPGWSGKPHACAVLAQLATRPILVFLDADVRIAPDGLARIIGFLHESGADLVSGLPRQETVGLVEKMVIPLAHFILLGFLPIRRMRAQPAAVPLGAGCGQVFGTTRRSYDRSGGHAVIRSTFHDGIQLPRAYRAMGLRTDLFDATDVATCRMYRSASELWHGLAKNATEGLAAPTMILPATLVLVGGQVLPVILVLLAGTLSAAERVLVALALGAAYAPRLIAVRRFQQSLLGAILHPIGILILLAIQWYALTLSVLGHPAMWKGRPAPSRTSRRPARGSP